MQAEKLFEHRHFVGIGVEIGFGGHEQGGEADLEGIIELGRVGGSGFGGCVARPLLEQHDLLLLQLSEDQIDLLDAGGLAEIDHQKGRVGRLQGVDQPWLHELLGDRRQVDELEMDVFVGEHAWHRRVGREGIGTDLGLRSGPALVKAGFAGVRRTDQADLRRALGANRVGGTAPAPPFLGTGEFLGELLDAALEVALNMLGSLVLGDGAEHLLEAVEAFARLPCLAVRLFGSSVLRCDVRGHRVEISLCVARLSSGEDGDSGGIR